MDRLRLDRVISLTSASRLHAIASCKREPEMCRKRAEVSGKQNESKSLEANVKAYKIVWILISKDSRYNLI